MFEASKRRGYRGDISIDDITLRDGPCNPKLTTKSGAVTPAPAATSLSTCTFQTGYCGFTQAKNDKFDWTRKRGTTSSSQTGPTTDHSTGTAAGMYIICYYMLLYVSTWRYELSYIICYYMYIEI